MLAPSLAKFGPLGVKEFEVFDLPYIFADKAALKKVLEGPVGRGLFDKLEGNGFVGLAYWDNGFKDKPPIGHYASRRTSADLRCASGRPRFSKRKCGH